MKKSKSFHTPISPKAKISFMGSALKNKTAKLKDSYSTDGLKKAKKPPKKFM